MSITIILLLPLPIFITLRNIKSIGNEIKMFNVPSCIRTGTRSSQFKFESTGTSVRPTYYQGLQGT